MKQAYDLAARKSKSCDEKFKAYFDSKVRSSVLATGDGVLVRNLSKRADGPGKLVSYWEDEIYIVVERKSNDSHVYAVNQKQKIGLRECYMGIFVFPVLTFLRRKIPPPRLLGLKHMQETETHHKKKTTGIKHLYGLLMKAGFI